MNTDKQLMTVGQLQEELVELEEENMDGALNAENLTLNLYKPLYEYHDALYRLWEENDYGHNFKDFVIEVFDMKIKKGKVAILIELGS